MADQRVLSTRSIFWPSAGMDGMGQTSDLSLPNAATIEPGGWIMRRAKTWNIIKSLKMNWKTHGNLYEKQLQFFFFAMHVSSWTFTIPSPSCHLLPRFFPLQCCLHASASARPRSWSWREDELGQSEQVWMRNNVSPAMIMVSVEGNIDQCLTGENLDSIIFQTIYIL